MIAEIKKPVGVALFVLAALFLFACTPPEQDLGREWFQGVFQRAATPAEVCSTMGESYDISQWQTDALGEGRGREKRCEEFVRIVQDYSKKSLVGAGFMQYREDESLGLVCFRESASSDRKALVPVVFSSPDDLRVEISPQPGQTWQTTPEMNRAGQILRRSLPEDCQRLRIW